MGGSLPTGKDFCKSVIKVYDRHDVGSWNALVIMIYLCVLIRRVGIIMIIVNNINIIFEERIKLDIIMDKFRYIG